MVTKPININDLVFGNDSNLDRFYSIQRKYLLSGIERRERNAPRTCITFAPDAKKRLYDIDNMVKYLMEPGEKLYHYNDWAARYTEHTARIAAVMQAYITPDSTIITIETLESALLVTEWYLNHFIVKMDTIMGPSDTETLLNWFESHLVRNGSYDFSRRGIMQNGPCSLRKEARLIPVLEQLSDEGKIQLWEDERGTHYVKYLAFEMMPTELDAKNNIMSGRSVCQGGGSVLSSIPLEE